MLFRELIQLYISEIIPRKKLQTQIKQRQQLAFWSKHLGEMQVKEVKAIDIIRVRGLLAISDASKNIYMAVLRHVFSVAIEQFELLEVNPASKVKNFRNKPGRVRFLSEDERKRFLIACEESSNPYLYIVALFALSSAGRKMEMMGLKWSQVDFENNVIYLDEQKNGDLGVLILIPKVTALLSEAFKDSKSEFVFKGRKDKPIDIRYPFQQALKRAGIKNFRFHDLRHTTASYLAMDGVSQIQLMEIMRHKSPASTKRYAHLSNQHKASVINKMWEKIKL